VSPVYAFCSTSSGIVSVTTVLEVRTTGTVVAATVPVDLCLHRGQDQLIPAQRLILQRVAALEQVFGPCRVIGDDELRALWSACS
jgi:hypothetical protein